MSREVAAEITRREFLREKVEHYFRAHPCEWIDAKTLMELGGAMAWRTRVSECRRIFAAEGGSLENRQQRPQHQIVRDTDAEPSALVLDTAAVISEYRYLPHQPLGRDAAERLTQKSLFG